MYDYDGPRAMVKRIILRSRLNNWVKVSEIGPPVSCIGFGLRIVSHCCCCCCYISKFADFEFCLRLGE